MTPPRTIAVVRALRGLGDLLCAVPSLRALRGAYPDARITLIGVPEAQWFASRFRSYVDDFLAFPGFPGIPERSYDADRFRAFLDETRRRAFDLVIQLHGNGVTSNAFAALVGGRRTAACFVPGFPAPDPELSLPYPSDRSEVHRMLALTEHLGVPTLGDHLEWPVEPRDEDDLLAAGRGFDEPTVVLHPGSHLPDRRWPLERFVAVGDALADDGYAIAVTGGRDEVPLARELVARLRRPARDLSGRTTLGGLALALSHARLVVTNDTGVSHLTAAVRTPSVVVFVVSDPDRWAPLDRNRHIPLGGATSSSRGGGAGPARLIDADRHEHGEPAPAFVAVDDVIAAARSLLTQGVGANA